MDSEEGGAASKHDSDFARIHEWLACPAEITAGDGAAFILSGASGTRPGIIVLCGSAVLSLIAKAAELHVATKAPILVSGGIGHSTRYLIDALFGGATAAHRSIPKLDEWLQRRLDSTEVKASERAADVMASRGLSEAEWIGSILLECFGVHPSKVILETKSTNCGANAIESTRIIQDQFLHGQQQVLDVIVLQDPSMMRRSILSFSHSIGPLLDNVVLFYQSLTFAEVGMLPLSVPDRLGFSFERYVSLLLGEHDRLRDDENGYGPRGKNFIDHCDMPEPVSTSFLALKAAFQASR